MTTLRFFLAALLALYSLLTSAGQQAATEDDEMKRCLNLAAIRTLDILDNQHIIFHTTGNQQYLNTLPHTCSGLNKHSTIMYRTALSQLCDLDTITVLNNIGAGFMRGPTCGLGKFEPINDEKLETLKSEMKPVREASK